MGHENTNRARSAAVKVLLAAGFSVATGSAMADAVIQGGAVRNVVSGVPYNANGSLVVGGNGRGEFNISSGGEATNTDAYIGYVDRGEVFVDGTDATWINNGFLIIGRAGEAFVIVDNGASVIVDDETVLADSSTSYAQLTLAGTAGARGVFSTTDIWKGFGTGLLQWDGGILQARNDAADFFFGASRTAISISRQMALSSTPKPTMLG